MDNRFDGLPRTKVAGVFFRCLHKRHKADPLNTAGSLLGNGARYNPPGEFAALYLSDSPRTSRNEVKRRTTLARDEDYPIFSVRIEIDNILDLTKSKIREKLLLRHDDDLTGDNYFGTQALAKAARASGFKGILAPSATGKGKSLVIFIDKTDKNDTLELDHS